MATQHGVRNTACYSVPEMLASDDVKPRSSDRPICRSVKQSAHEQSPSDVPYLRGRIASTGATFEPSIDFGCPPSRRREHRIVQHFLVELSPRYAKPPGAVAAGGRGTQPVSQSCSLLTGVTRPPPPYFSPGGPVNQLFVLSPSDCKLRCVPSYSAQEGNRQVQDF